MGNSRVKDRFALALEGKQVLALAVGVTVLVAGVFVLGLNLGRRSVVTAAVIAAPRDPLAHLDEPLPVRDDAVELKAHQALTDTRPIDKSLPVPQVKATTVAITPHAAVLPAPTAVAAPVREERVVASPPPLPTRRAPARAEKVAAPAKRGHYAIQIASLAKRSEAERVAKQNGSRSPRIVEAEIPGKGRHYRVLVGSYETQDAAKRQLAVLTRSGLKGIVTAVR